ncbi:MAG: hypothetical protein NZ742_04910 [Acidobacteria bacterium]|nr:hypothetical protein [Acidobacteriota bacterium]MDW7984210.1 hypothetical protein [Acidobacteriota bacterium]
MTGHLGPYEACVVERLRAWQAAGFIRRLRGRDPTLWFPGPVPEVTDRLGWLELPVRVGAFLKDLRAFAEAVRAEGTRHVVLLGMGGSSLAPETFQQTFGNAPGYPALIVLDSTHPAAVSAVMAPHGSSLSDLLDLGLPALAGRSTTRLLEMGCPGKA